MEIRLDPVSGNLRGLASLGIFRDCKVSNLPRWSYICNFFYARRPRKSSSFIGFKVSLICKSGTLTIFEQTWAEHQQKAGHTIYALAGAKSREPSPNLSVFCEWPPNLRMKILLTGLIRRTYSANTNGSPCLINHHSIYAKVSFAIHEISL